MSGNITDNPVEFGPLITNIVVALRADLPLRSCAASNVHVQNVCEKYT